MKSLNRRPVPGKLNNLFPEITYDLPMVVTYKPEAKWACFGAILRSPLAHDFRQGVVSLNSNTTFVRECTLIHACVIQSTYLLKYCFLGM